MSNKNSNKGNGNKKNENVESDVRTDETANSEETDQANETGSEKSAPSGVIEGQGQLDLKQDEKPEKSVKTSKLVNAFPLGEVRLFGLEQTDHITFEAREYLFKNGKFVSSELIGVDMIATLKHKLHRRIYDSTAEQYRAASTSRATTDKSKPTND